MVGQGNHQLLQGFQGRLAFLGFQPRCGQPLFPEAPGSQAETSKPAHEGQAVMTEV
jgi:hypothetical protein